MKNLTPDDVRKAAIEAGFIGDNMGLSSLLFANGLEESVDVTEKLHAFAKILLKGNFSVEEKQELTNIYPPDIKPIRKGVYQTRFVDDSKWYYSYWDGKEWWISETTVYEAAFSFRYLEVAEQNKFWRGLTCQAD